MNDIEQPSHDTTSAAEHQGDLRPSRMRFSLTTMIVTISLACLVMGNIISAGKWYYETQALKRELAIAERTTGYLVVDDPTKIQVTSTSTGVRGLWRFQVHLPEGRDYRMCYQIGDIPKEGTPERTGRTHKRDLGPGKVDLSFHLHHDHEDEWWIHQRGSWKHGNNTQPIASIRLGYGTWEWLEAHPVRPSSSKVRRLGRWSDGSVPGQYFLVDVQGVLNTQLSGHMSYDPSKTLDLIKIRATEIQGPEEEPTDEKFGFFDPLSVDAKALEANNKIPEISDGIQLWIEPVPIP